jgi:hypothetical protein
MPPPSAMCRTRHEMLIGSWPRRGHFTVNTRFSAVELQPRLIDSRAAYFAISCHAAYRSFVNRRNWHFHESGFAVIDRSQGQLTFDRKGDRRRSDTLRISLVPRPQTLTGPKHLRAGKRKGQQAPQILANRTGGCSPEDRFGRIPRTHHQTHAPGDRHGGQSSSGPLQVPNPGAAVDYRFPRPSDRLM